MTEELSVAHDDVRAVGRSLLESGAQEAGSHLYELAERFGELNQFATALRDLVEQAQDRRASSFSRESLKKQLKNK